MSTPALISSRWTPNHIIRRDTFIGTFEEINSPISTGAEQVIQRALLEQPTTRRWFTFILLEDPA